MAKKKPRSLKRTKPSAKEAELMSDETPDEGDDKSELYGTNERKQREGDDFNTKKSR